MKKIWHDNSEKKMSLVGEILPNLVDISLDLLEILLDLAEILPKW